MGAGATSSYGSRSRHLLVAKDIEEQIEERCGVGTVVWTFVPVSGIIGNSRSPFLLLPGLHLLRWMRRHRPTSPLLLRNHIILFLSLWILFSLDFALLPDVFGCSFYHRYQDGYLFQIFTALDDTNMAGRDDNGSGDDAFNLSLGSQGSSSSSTWLSEEGEDQVTQIQAVVDLEFDRARFDREWEAGFGEDASSSVSNASTNEVEDDEDVIFRQASQSFRRLAF